MKLKEKVAHLQGVIEALSFDKDEKEIFVYETIAALLEDIVDEMEKLDGDVDIICDELDAIDEDLDELEEELEHVNESLDLVYEDLYDEDDLDLEEEHEDEEFEFEGDIYDVICPSCGDEICVDDSILDLGSIHCPNCDEKLTFEIDMEEESLKGLCGEGCCQETKGKEDFTSFDETLSE